ncbi:MAG TPA: DUF4097 family beta strand repeat-containing protein [Terracidiphilus sp.]|jgi:DUF4097 and DUF4098 domain-containing protein YvlB|nr:DUF4097 family beta strand repeat-containing protein [Terracidiphilus sp.]
MSSMPPGGGAPPPYPPYDPKTQWRVYREQQKAAWRAQRDAMRAQRDAWKVQHGYGPRVPSLVGPVILIGVGVIALLIVTGHMSGAAFWMWYSRWWPLLLILAGLGMLAEWAIDMRRETPIRRSGSFVGIIIFLAILGFVAAGWNHASPWFNQWNHGDQEDFFNMFGLPEHEIDQQVLNAQVGPGAEIDIQNPRGDVSVSAGDTPTVEVQAHEVAFASSDNDARKIFETEAAHINVNGNAVLIRSDGHNNGRVNFTVTVPKTAKVTIKAARGDVAVSGLGGGLDLTATRGDVHLNSITGTVQAHLSNNKHDFSAHQVDGDLLTDGNTNDLTISQIKGRLSVNGDVFGELHVENVTGPVSVHTSRTDVQIASLPGDLTFDSDNLRVNQSKGLVHVVTRSKDIDLNQIYGDSYVETRDGRIAILPAGAFSIEAKNNKGDVEITLPPNASANVSGRTHNGDIVTDYGLNISGEQDKSVSGKIGSGQATIDLSTSNGDLRIKKGPALPSAPSVANAPTAPTAPVPPNAKHLKAPPKELPTEPVTQ